MNGKFKRWYKNGQIHVETKYKDDYLSGQFTEWHKNGNMKKEGRYIGMNRDWNDSSGRDGIWKFWNEDGQIIREIEYKDEGKIGQYIEWYNNGNMEKKGEYDLVAYKGEFFVEEVKNETKRFLR